MGYSGGRINLVLLPLRLGFMAVSVGSPAAISCELRQARKGAAAAVDSSAGMQLAGTAALNHHP